MPKIVFDSNRCTGCRACEGACKQEHNLPVGTRRRIVSYMQAGEYPKLSRVYKSNACKHCSKPKCMEACPASAITKNSASGIVDVNKDECIGCRACIDACPFNAMSFEIDEQKASKCNYCKERLAQGVNPACVNVCMGLALSWKE